MELEPEIATWFQGLGQSQRARAAFHIDRLEEYGPLLDEPFTRQLSGKLRELRFHLDGTPTRLSYWIAPGRRIVLLTVFTKHQRQERREVERALVAFRRCRSERHLEETP